MTTKKRRTLIRLSLIILIILFSFFLYLSGKQHEIFIDNKTIIIENEEYLNINTAKFKINDQDFIDIAKRKRKKVVVSGPNHKIIVEYEDESGEKISISKNISLGLKKDMIINIPALINNNSKFITEKE
ncbi:hypothetical protein OF820_10940 [Oceanotoga sp. DSM 15011]|jgi:hypothetical protein|uniref:Uncharacterized protein n=1 Tax=Oceanotoga teriensis TaxID=515440 RepID=A0AA45C871_9BACT|nr:MULTISPECIES: DUF6672 family protein [Oceanotoga]MDO7976951.1 hypothetical protein [Oceanotoga teriensis]PWJ95747.1 hypothetical protein C7380_104166 [Oceanotoga teriensis]UYO99580.1 hypothetical protein OF820_10940 [Oceanotoga sp. DSM 15011]